MKKKFHFLTLLGLCSMVLGGCDYNYTYTVPAYPPTDVNAQDNNKVDPVLPTSISLSENTKTLVIGESFVLYPTISPFNTTDASLTWTTSEMNIASVDRDGEVTANGLGTATITAKCNANNQIFATCLVTVEAPVYKVESVALSSYEETIKVGNVLSLFATVSPENASDKSVEWSSTDARVVSVDKGMIKGEAPGTAIVMVKTHDQHKKDYCVVTVRANMGDVIMPTGLSIEPNNVSVQVGDSVQLVSKVTPSNADDRTVTWSSNNTNIAEVSAQGIVTTKAMGTAVIKATSRADSSITAECVITVTEQVVSVTSVVVNPTSLTMEIGDTASLTATVLPQNAANKLVSWESSNPGVASVENGVVTAIASGSSVIKVITADGNKSASCAVVVNADQSTAESGFEDTGVDDAGTYDIKIWCDERIVDDIKADVQNFRNHYGSKYTINLTVDEVSEGNAATMMTEDVSSGADIFVFAQDQLSKLKTAGALANLTKKDYKTIIENETEKEGVEAASINGKLYAFPFTSDNGYFMYYDKTIVKEDSVGDIEKIIADCKAANKKINYNIFGNGFYTASYFMATGCESTWDMDSTNKFTAYHDNYNSEAGFKAAKGIQYLKANNIFANDDSPSKFGKTIGACVSGIWNYSYAKQRLGDNLGCAPMPSFTLDGERIHISSFFGYKLLGVKPQTDAKKVSVCKRIARYISSYQCQLDRFNSVGWAPTNITALNNPAVLAHPGLQALRAQKPYSKQQVQCPSSWFSSVSTLAASIGAESSDAEIWAALKLYEDNLESLLND